MKKTLFITSLLSSFLMVSTNTVADIDPARQNELLYFIKHDCGSCHGMTLKGGLGPSLLPDRLAGQPKDYLVTTIMEGRKGTAMPPWKTMLSHEDASWIADQLQGGSMLQTELAQKKTHNNQSGSDQAGSEQ